MPNKMLIDATHPEETRVVVTRGNRIEEFDFESAARKPLRGNIYLAKVTRVEPSLQAAFVDFGGNRHGFLAFNEIHPDYYQIPVADRQALIEEDARADREAQRRSDESSHRRGRRGKRDEAEEAGQPLAAEDDRGDAREASDDHESAHAHSPVDEKYEAIADDTEGDEDDVAEEDAVTQLGGADALEELPERSRVYRRQYKIQEVIKRRQVLLVQVVKEERGTKGAALTTYLSLAGRYSVLMPNTARGGGISRKITNATDRKRLKSIATDLEIPAGMGIILRTAGAARTKPEIKRDFEYLLRVWENVRELTLQSSAPMLVYEEGSLVKRAIRDLYSKELEEVLVAGDDGYKEAKEFMRMLAPSHARQVKAYKDAQPIFTRFGVEAQLDAMFSNQVTLKSGGYIVLNQTEALVAIDVNSGRSTREHNIEDTALKTNLEASDEVARQLRLRDLAGLIVIDFIDMEEKRNNRSVERRLKEGLKNDRARIQVGRISPFGLLEMSRQRIRTGVVEGSTVQCSHCGGAGHVRATPSVSLHILRALEDQLIRANSFNLIVRTRADVALYVLNHKRGHIAELEHRFGVTITISPDESLGAARTFVVDRGDAAVAPRVVVTTPATADPTEAEPEIEEEIEEAEEAVEAVASEEPAGEREAGEDREPEARGADGDPRRRRRRRRRRGRDGDSPREEAGEERAAPRQASDEDDGGESRPAADRPSDVDGGSPREADDGARDEDGDGRARRRRRGRRGGRRGRGENGAELAADAAANGDAASDEAPPPRAGEADLFAPPPEPPVTMAQVPAPIVPKPEPLRRQPDPLPPPAVAEIAEAAAIKAAREVAVSNPDAYRVNAEASGKPKRAGWWSKAKAAVTGQ